MIAATGEFHREREPPGSLFYIRGFSLAELIAVILVVSVLSVFAVTRFSGNLATTRGFYDELLSQVQYARKVAIAQRRPVFVRIDATQSQLCYNAVGACSGVASPTGSVPFTLGIPVGVSATPATIEFDALGRYPAVAQLSVTVADADGNLQFRVEHETGYVRP